MDDVEFVGVMELIFGRVYESKDGAKATGWVGVVGRDGGRGIICVKEDEMVTKLLKI